MMQKNRQNVIVLKNNRGTMKKNFSSTLGIIVVGSSIGIIAALLQYLGNPGNMGFCIACFARDTAGAIGIHSVNKLSYVRPEITGIIVGSLVASLIFKDFKPRGGSSTIIRFFFGAFAAVGALVFLGCPWRAALRLAGGDLNALTGLAGLIFGIFIASRFTKMGYSLGRSHELKGKASGFVLPAFMSGILLLMVFKFTNITVGSAPHAPILISLVLALIVGFIAQRSRFCTVGAFRNIIMVKDFHLFKGIISLILAAFIMNLILDQFKLGFIGQPAAHTMQLWNFLGMVLSGMCFTLAGGCPGRQLVLAGEGDNDAATFFMGLVVGAGIAHNFGLTSSGKGIGIGQYGAAGTIIGIIFCLIIGFTMIEKRAK